MRSQVESGAELLARLNDKPSLRGLEDTLFPEGPRNADVIEIGGERSTGKTLLLSQMLAKCILPDYHRAVRIEGCNASAIFINTDHHFQTAKLMESMSGIVDTGATDTDFDKTTVIQDSLRNLHVIDCYDSEQLYLTLRTLDEMFLDNAKIALVAIDSLTAYYWQDREDNVITIDAYVKKLLKLVKTHTTRFNVVTIYTRSYECSSGKKFTGQFANNLDRKVLLRRMPDSQSLLCTLETGEITKEIRYSILPTGIKWQTDKGLG